MASSKPNRLKRFIVEGEPFIWISGLGITMVLLMGLIFLSSIVKNGMVAFWPKTLVQYTMADGNVYLGEVNQDLEEEGRLQLKIGNRDFYPQDFVWIYKKDIQSQSEPETAISLERMEYGNFYGFFVGLESPAVEIVEEDWIEQLLEASETDRAAFEKLNEEIQVLAVEMQDYRMDLLELRHDKAPHAEILKVEASLAKLRSAFDKITDRQGKAKAKLDQHKALIKEVGGETKALPVEEIVRGYQPNQMGIFSKIGLYLSKIWELFFGEPRESNTEGGLFPALVGTIMLIFTMSIFSFPLGVMAAVYLKEYAKPGPLVQAIRITVNNLAGVPSIVWGIFGLGFFVYIVGGGLDALFFSERAPTPTFGTGGVLWASLTLALLTVPVVIVATEEALGSVSKDLRLGSLALGATKFQTLTRVILPMASPRIITGFILAMSRAAGEVAPLMITGVVKLAPTLPIDGSFPFVHLERKFMHLGFHIYDISFQSPNVEAAKPMVFVTTLLLLGVVIAMSSFSIYIRQKMKKRYASKAF